MERIAETHLAGSHLPVHAGRLAELWVLWGGRWMPLPPGWSLGGAPERPESEILHIRMSSDYKNGGSHIRKLHFLSLQSLIHGVSVQHGCDELQVQYL